MQNYLLRNLSELAHKHAIIMREEAQLWDILARDLKREAGRLEETPNRRIVRDPSSVSISETNKREETKLFVRILEAAKMMGISRSALYNEINASRIKTKKSGRKTLIAVSEIHDWFNNLPEC